MRVRQFKVLELTRNEHPAAALFETFAVCSGRARNLFSSYEEAEQCLWKAFFLLKMQKHRSFSVGFFGQGRLGWRCTHLKATRKFLPAKTVLLSHRLLQELCWCSKCCKKSSGFILSNLKQETWPCIDLSVLYLPTFKPILPYFHMSAEKSG